MQFDYRIHLDICIYDMTNGIETNGYKREDNSNYEAGSIDYLNREDGQSTSPEAGALFPSFIVAEKFCICGKQTS